MAKKLHQKIEVKEIKSYKCSDGSVFNTKEEAESHELFLEDCKKNPLIGQKFTEMQAKIAELEVAIHFLEGRITKLEGERAFKPVQPQIWPPYPYQNPIRFDEESKKLPSEPGNIVWNAKNHSSNKRSN